MLYQDRSKWFRQPPGRIELNGNHPLAPWLLLAIVPGMVRHELRTGEYLRTINTASTAFPVVPQDFSGGGLVAEGLDVSTSGFWMPWKRRFQDISDQMTLLFGAEIDDWNEYGEILSKSRGSQSTWGGTDFTIGRWATNNTIGFNYRTTTGALAFQSWNWDPQPGGAHEGFQSVGLTFKVGGTRTGYSNNVALVNSQAEEMPVSFGHMLGFQYLNFMNRLHSDPGYAIDGRLEWLFLFNKHVEADVLRDLHRAPYQLFKPSRQMRVYESLTDSLQTVIPGGIDLSVGIGVPTITGADGTSIPFLQEFHQPNKIRTGGDIADYRSYSNFTFSRTGNVYDLNDRNELQVYGFNEPVWNMDGMRHEPAATNLVPNSAGDGANAGTNTFPTGWSFSKPGTFPTVDLSGTGVDGAPYVEFTFDEVNNEVARDVDINLAEGMLVSSGQSYVGSIFIKPMGRMTHAPKLQIVEADIGDVELGISSNSTGGANFLHTGTVSRLIISRSMGASAASATLRLRFTVLSGARFVAKFRVYLPQLELGPLPTSAIKTTGVALSRVASTFVANINFGTYTSITEEWINERTAQVERVVQNAPFVPDTGYVVAPKAGKRLRRFALDMPLSETFYVTSNPAADIPVRGTGQTIFIEPGIYNAGNITLGADGITVFGMVNTILEGAAETTGWTWDGNYWTKSGIPTGWTNNPENAWVSLPYSANRIDLFVNGEYVPQKISRAELGPGEWAVEAGVGYYKPGESLDVAEVKMTNVDGPLFSAGALVDCQFRNLRAYRYSWVGKRGSFIDFNSDLSVGSGNVVADCILKQHHLTAIGLGNDTEVLRTYVLESGGAGIYAGLNDVARTTLLLDGCFVSKTGQLSIDPDEDDGGILLQWFSEVEIKNTEITLGKGRGIWFDWRVHDTLVENCYVHENENVGVEIKDSGRDTGETWHDLSYCNLRRNGTTDFLSRGSQYVRVRNSRILSDVGVAWLFTGNLNSPFEEDFPVFRSNTVIMVAGDQYNGLKAANADGGATTYAKWFDNLNVDLNTYYAVENNDIRWEWVTDPGAAEQVIYDGTTVPTGGEASSTFNIVGTPADQEVFGFLLNQQTVTPAGLSISVDFGESTIPNQAQSVIAPGIPVEVAIGSPLLATDGMLIANGISILVEIGVPTITVAANLVRPESLVLSVEFGEPTIITEQFTTAEGFALKIEFGSTETQNPQPDNFQTSYFDINPNRG